MTTWSTPSKSIPRDALQQCLENNSSDFLCLLLPRKTTEVRYLTDTHNYLKKSRKDFATAYLSVHTKNKEMFSTFELRNSFMFASLLSWSSAAWNGKIFIENPFLSKRFNAFSTFLQLSICICMQDLIWNENCPKCNPRAINILAGGTQFYWPCYRRRLFLELGYPLPVELGHSFCWEKLCPDFFQLFHLHCNLQGPVVQKTDSISPIVMRTRHDYAHISV